MHSFVRGFLRFLGAVVMVALIVILCFVVLPIFMIIDFILQAVGFKTWVDEDEVYDNLSDVAWMTSKELKAEIHQRRLESQKFSLVYNDIVPILFRLEDLGLVERRVRILNQEEKNRYGAYSRHEFRRKPNGKRVRKPPRKWFELPMPTPAFGNA